MVRLQLKRVMSFSSQFHWMLFEPWQPQNSSKRIDHSCVRRTCHWFHWTCGRTTWCVCVCVCTRVAWLPDLPGLPVVRPCLSCTPSLLSASSFCLSRKCIRDILSHKSQRQLSLISRRRLRVCLDSGDVEVNGSERTGGKSG